MRKAFHFTEKNSINLDLKHIHDLHTLMHTLTHSPIMFIESLFCFGYFPHTLHTLSHLILTQCPYYVVSIVIFTFIKSERG